jgi:hypothetical protein
VRSRGVPSSTPTIPTTGPTLGEERAVADITELREVRVRGEEATFVFVAEPDKGRLVIREEREEGDGEDVCALRIADSDELRGFLEGIRRVLGLEVPSSTRGGDATGRGGGPANALPPQRSNDAPAPPPPSPAGDDDREAAIARARERGHGKAFAAWTPDEERRLLAAVDEGRDLDELAREHGRSRRALEMRLEKLRR